MSIVDVSDASPLNYLALIDAVGVLPRLYSAVLIPPAVAAELTSPKAPAVVAFERCLVQLQMGRRSRAKTRLCSPLPLHNSPSVILLHWWHI